MTFLNVVVPPPIAMPPPSLAGLSVIVLLSRVNVEKLLIPPPEPFVEFALKVVLVTETEPRPLTIPPPSPMTCKRPAVL